MYLVLTYLILQGWRDLSRFLRVRCDQPGAFAVVPEALHQHLATRKSFRIKAGRSPKRAEPVTGPLERN